MMGLMYILSFHVLLPDFNSNALATRMHIGADTVNAVTGRPQGDFNLVVIWSMNDDVLTGQCKGDWLHRDDCIKGAFWKEKA